jgi:hypothetical protein
MGEYSAYKVLVVELEVPIEDLDVGGRIILGWVLREIVWDYMEWINVAQDKILWWAFGFYKMLGN